jgi:hypothetical protein
MADNVQFQSNQLATPASGTQVSTDEAASGHIQRVKLTYSANGSDTHAQVDADGLLVNLGAHEDAVGTAMATTDIGIATKSAIFGYTTSGGGAFEPVKVTPSGALTVEVSDGGGSITVDGTVAATQSGTWNLNNIAGTISLPTGAATETSLASVAGAVSSSNLRVIPVSQTPISSSAAQVTSVTASASNVTLLSSAGARVGFAIYNDSASVCYLKFGVTASSTSFTVLLSAGSYYEFAGHGVYTGQVDAIWATATGSARVTSW